MRNLKSIIASIVMLVSVMVMTFGSQDVNAMQPDDDWTEIGDFDGPLDQICAVAGDNCQPEIIIVKKR